MKTKAFIFRHGEGEYDGYVEFTDAVLIGNASANIEELKKEYGIYYHATRDVWITQNVKKLKEGIHYMSFPKWLVATKKMKEVEFEEILD